MFLCQRKHALEIIDECGLVGVKPADFPLEENSQISFRCRETIE